MVSSDWLGSFVSPNWICAIVRKLRVFYSGKNARFITVRVQITSPECCCFFEENLRCFYTSLVCIKLYIPSPYHHQMNNTQCIWWRTCKRDAAFNLAQSSSYSQSREPHTWLFIGNPCKISTINYPSVLLWLHTGSSCTTASSTFFEKQESAKDCTRRWWCDQ